MVQDTNTTPQAPPSAEPQQQQAVPQPVVVVVNQPMMDPRHQNYSAGRPYLNRGAQFDNGCRCYLPHILLMCTLGGFLAFIGLTVVCMGVPAGSLLLAVGGLLLCFGIYTIRVAKRQFNSLPPDHPDRTKYTARTIFASTGPGQGSAVYTLPPLQSQMMQNQLMSYPSSTGGQIYLMQLPPGSYPPNLSSGQVQFAVPSPGASMPQNTYRPENDLPPAYSDVVRNA